jgi:hypothetical protein
MKKTILVFALFIGMATFANAQTIGQQSSPDVTGVTKTAPANNNNTSSSPSSTTPAPVKNNNRETYGSGNIDNSKHRDTSTPRKASPQTEK